MMQISAAWEPGNPFLSVKNSNLFNKHVGSTEWWNEITTRGAQARVSEFVQKWSYQAKQFQQQSRQFWLYQ